MRRVEVIAIVTDLVYLDDKKAGDEGRDAHEMEEEMRSCSSSFLAGSMGGLKNEGCLCDEEKTGRIEKGMWREEDEIVGEDCAPDDCYEDPNAGLGKWCCAYPEVLE